MKRHEISARYQALKPGRTRELPWVCSFHVLLTTIHSFRADTDGNILHDLNHQSEPAVLAAFLWSVVCVMNYLFNFSAKPRPDMGSQGKQNPKPRLRCRTLPLQAVCDAHQQVQSTEKRHGVFADWLDISCPKVVYTRDAISKRGGGVALKLEANVIGTSRPVAVDFGRSPGPVNDTFLAVSNIGRNGNHDKFPNGLQAGRISGKEAGTLSKRENVPAP
ncbi:hypothetical protein V8F06_006873 [Rhypophila decipiens]